MASRAEREAAERKALEEAATPPAPHLQDGQTAPGFNGDVAPDPADTIREVGRPGARLLGERAGEESQDTFVPPPPGKAQPGYINPPALETFANATYLPAGPEIRKIVEKVLKFDELNDLAGDTWMAVWRRKGKPTWTRNADDRQFVGTEITSPLTLWIAGQHEDATFPKYVINLFWLHLDELRSDEDGARYVPNAVMERHVMMALLGLERSESGVLTKHGLGFSDWAKVVARYGMFSDELVDLRRQMKLWPDPDEG